MSWLPPSHLDHQLSDNRLKNQNTSLVFPNWIVSIFVSRSAALGKIEPSSGGLTCRVRCATLDDLFRFGGHDKRAPPIFCSEGPACQVRRPTFDNPRRIGGHDRRAPPIRAWQARPSKRARQTRRSSLFDASPTNPTRTPFWAESASGIFPNAGGALNLEKKVLQHRRAGERCMLNKRNPFTTW